MHQKFSLDHCECRHGQLNCKMADGHAVVMMHVKKIASLSVQLLFSLPPWQAAVHFRPAFVHAHFLQAPAMHRHPALSDDILCAAASWPGISPHRRHPNLKAKEGA